MVASEIKELPTQEELEKLFVNNAGLQTIDAFLNRFNPIRVMRMERMEIRHSAILAWLLDPQESHGLDDKFLRAFLGEALKGCELSQGPTALDVSQADLRDVEVRCEWQHIDIFIYSGANRWAFVIENKFDSSQHGGQLAKYFERVEKYCGGVGEPDRGDALAVRGIFLTLHDEEPEDGRYAPFGYDSISEILPGLLAQEANSLSQEVSTFLAHYIEVLEDALETSEEHKKMEKLARQLYRDHRKALKFVMEHGQTTNFEFAMHNLGVDDPEYDVPVRIEGRTYHFNWLGQDQASFVPASWYDGFGADTYSWDGCEDWWMGEPMIVWFHLRRRDEDASGQLRLYAEVGPLTEHKFRKKLIRGIETTAEENGSPRIKFQRGAADEGKRFSKFFKNNTHHIQDVQDSDEITLAAKALLESFAPEFEMIGKILRQFQKYGTE